MGVQSMPFRVAGVMGNRGNGPPVQFVVENADWAIRWVGEGIRDGLSEEVRGKMATTLAPQRLIHRVAHFGSQYMWVDWAPHLSRTNQPVASFFHGKPEDGLAVEKHIDRFLKTEPQLRRIVASAGIVRQRLMDWGVASDKIVHIPIGTDMAMFTPPMAEDRAAARARFGFSNEAIVVGSFQKDGVGWGDGLEPKPIKGPDVFLDAVEQLAKELPVEVLLSGPARGFVKAGLRARGIPFQHHYPPARAGLLELYHALDLYLMTSREEGGPMALMESMAARVPVVSTAVGMAPDLIVDGVTGGLAASEDVDGLVDRAKTILALDEVARGQLTAKAHEVVLPCDWKVVARRHWEEVYQPLLDEAV
ncbi:MAG: glycosyltransferase family 4 protein [Verrucomicrobia subdivision 3 bacterium]|nr:glycosyltransferase family 4 protein [Limisphaerales bacterium]